MSGFGVDRRLGEQPFPLFSVLIFQQISRFHPFSVPASSNTPGVIFVD
jgi:hypothetical protein